MSADREMRKEIEALFTAHMAYLTQRLAAGEISLADWQIAMREDIRRAHALQMIAGAGGDVTKIAPSDWLRLGPAIKAQDKFLTEFARDMASGKIDPATARERAALYAESAAVEFSRQATKGVNLPAHPPIHNHCSCQWIEIDGQWYWELGGSNNCEVCTQHAGEWSPYQGAA